MTLFAWVTSRKPGMRLAVVREPLHWVLMRSSCELIEIQSSILARVMDPMNDAGQSDSIVW